MLSTVRRHFAILQALPRAPSFITVADLRARLAAHDVSVSKRTLQEDLVFLLAHFEVARTGTPAAYGWAWARSAKPVILGGLSSEAAITFKLMAAQMQHLVPPHALSHMRPLVLASEQALVGARLHREWARKVRVLPRGLPLSVPATDGRTVSRVYAALFEGTQCELTYRPVGRQAWTRSVNPLGLVFRGPTGYLVCTYVDGDGALRTLHLARMLSARKSEVPSERPKDFDLDAIIAAGDLGVRRGPQPLRLEIRVSERAGGFLRDEKLAPDQVLVARDGWLRVAATVPDNEDLRRFVLSLGGDVEVLRPEGLRREVAGLLQRAAAFYGESSGRAADSRTPAVPHG